MGGRGWGDCIAAIVEGKGSRGMEAGVDGTTPMSANAQRSFGGEGEWGCSGEWAGRSSVQGRLQGKGGRRR
jgi:hypothetical protein